jgi:hypothetical protein
VTERSRETPSVLQVHRSRRRRLQSAMKQMCT